MYIRGFSDAHRKAAPRPLSGRDFGETPKEEDIEADEFMREILPLMLGRVPASGGPAPKGKRRTDRERAAHELWKEIKELNKKVTRDDLWEGDTYEL